MILNSETDQFEFDDFDREMLGVPAENAPADYKHFIMKRVQQVYDNAVERVSSIDSVPANEVMKPLWRQIIWANMAAELIVKDTLEDKPEPVDSNSNNVTPLFKRTND